MHVFSSFCWCVPLFSQASMISVLSAITRNFLLPCRLCILVPHVHCTWGESRVRPVGLQQYATLFCRKRNVLLLYLYNVLFAYQWSLAVNIQSSQSHRHQQWIRTLLKLSFFSFCSSETQNLLAMTQRCCTSSPPSVKRITRPCWGFPTSWNTWRAPAKVRCRPHTNLIANERAKYNYTYCGSMSCIFVPQHYVFAWRWVATPPSALRLDRNANVRPDCHSARQ